jgi:hypothetical protein
VRVACGALVLATRFGAPKHEARRFPLAFVQFLANSYFFQLGENLRCILLDYA